MAGKLVSKRVGDFVSRVCEEIEDMDVQDVMFSSRPNLHRRKKSRTDAEAKRARAVSVAEAAAEEEAGGEEQEAAGK